MFSLTVSLLFHHTSVHHSPPPASPHPSQLITIHTPALHPLHDGNHELVLLGSSTIPLTHRWCSPSHSLTLLFCSYWLYHSQYIPLTLHIYLVILEYVLASIIIELSLSPSPPPHNVSTAITTMIDIQCIIHIWSPTTSFTLSVGTVDYSTLRHDPRRRGEATSLSGREEIVKWWVLVGGQCGFQRSCGCWRVDGWCVDVGKSV